MYLRYLVTRSSAMAEGPHDALVSIEQPGLAVASIARDDPSTIPGDDPFPRTH